MSALVTPQITASYPAAISAMPPAEIDAKLIAAGLPTYTAQEKAEDARELALGMNKGDVTELLYNFGEGGISLPGLNVLAAPTGLVTSLFARDYYTKRDLAKMTDEYRDFIAEKMQVPAEQVTEEHLKACAQQQPALASALLAVARKRETHVTTNAMGIGGMTGGTMAGAALGTALLPFLPGIGTLAGGLVGGMIGYEGGEGMGKYLLDVTEQGDPAALCEALQKKKEDGSYISREDVFALKLAQHPKIREQVVERHGDNFARLDEVTRKEVMAGLPALAQQAARDAVLCNFPQADVRALMFGDLAPQPANFQAAPGQKPLRTQWTAKIAAERGGQMNAPREVGFAEAILRGREAFEPNLQV